jgi:hypothetical protein
MNVIETMSVTLYTVLAKKMIGGQPLDQLPFPGRSHEWTMAYLLTEPSNGNLQLQKVQMANQLTTMIRIHDKEHR